jgi:hypothetical protein
MQLQAIKARLLQMKGLTFNYKTHIHKVANARGNEEDEKFEIVTDKNWFTFNLSEAEKVFDDFEKVNNPETSIENTNTGNNGVVSFGGNKTAEVFDILKDTITKLQQDPKYATQANGINKTVSTMINLKKIELQLKRGM